jgi:hypothetical protein
VLPGGRHGLLEGAGVLLIVAVGGDAFDPNELCQGVDTVGFERFDKLGDGLRWDVLEI